MTVPDDPEDDGIFASLLRQYGKSVPFWVGTTLSFAAVTLGVFGLFAGPTGAIASRVAQQVAALAGLIALWINRSRYGTLRPGGRPLPSDGGKPMPIRFVGSGGGYFAKGAGRVQFPEGMIRFLEDEIEWWDLIVVLGIVAATVSFAGVPLGMVLAGVSTFGLPRRRTILAEVRIEDVESIVATRRAIRVTTISGEPRREFVIDATTYAGRRATDAFARAFPALQRVPDARADDPKTSASLDDALRSVTSLQADAAQRARP